MKPTSLILRALMIGGLAVLLLIPLTLIRATVSERASFRALATQRVSQSMAGPQQWLGPLRVVPYRQSREVESVGPNGAPITRVEVIEGRLVQAPKTMRVEGELHPGTRRIGLYDVRVFEWRAELSATFEAMALTEEEGREYGEPYLVVGVADLRGVVGTPTLKVDGAPRAFEPGTRAMSERMTGMHALLGEGPAPEIEVAIEIALLGTRTLGITPIADSNDITLRSSWPHPLFGGSFLPNERAIDDAGFRARWRVSSLASSAQSALHAEGSLMLTQRMDASYSRGDYASAPDTVGAATESMDVSLVEPVDVYTQAERASKYGILFVLLTFVGFALFELIKTWPIHPIQYLLVGLSIAIFFLLLLSLAEHVAFFAAYAIAAAACIGLQFVYLSGVLASRLRAAGFAATLTALYGVLYALLLSEDNALLMGSLLLFGTLAAVMWLTRKIDWYALGKPEETPLTPRADHA